MNGSEAPAPRLLEVSDLAVHFDGPGGVVRAVDGISLTLGAGEALGLVGESGSGKTVTALALLGLAGRPHANGRILPGSSVRLRGEELVGTRERRMRAIRGNEMAMVFQDPLAALDPVYTVGDQIAEALRLHRGTGRREARGEAVRLLEEVGIPEAGLRVDAYPHELSGGMAQRAMIAIALACEPALLVADEPTTALDPTVQAGILDLLGRIRAERGTAILLITHDLSIVAEVCERVAVVYGGRIVETGSVEEVFANPAHPYTSALLGAIPPGVPASGRLRAIPGAVPSAAAWPDGCRFRPRCPLAFERCTAEPPLAPLAGAGRSARCWLVAESAPPEEESP